MPFPFSFSIPEPHDARVRSEHQVHQQTALISKPLPEQISPSDPNSRDLLSPRSLKQFSIFAAGASFTAISALITRRALARKYHSVKPSGLFSPSNKVNDVNGGVEAAEALVLATLNVSAVAMMLTGGTLWALDVSSLDDLRRRLRRLDIYGDSKSEQKTEEDIEEYMGILMAKLQGKDDRDIAELLKQSVQKNESDKP